MAVSTQGGTHAQTCTRRRAISQKRLRHVFLLAMSMGSAYTIHTQ
ncbi:MAG: hypothetical protein ACR2LN_07250 [Candidatus Levyibacteriota bacterium]